MPDRKELIRRLLEDDRFKEIKKTYNLEDCEPGTGLRQSDSFFNNIADEISREVSDSLENHPEAKSLSNWMNTSIGGDTIQRLLHFKEDKTLKPDNLKHQKTRNVLRFYYGLSLHRHADRRLFLRTASDKGKHSRPTEQSSIDNKRLLGNWWVYRLHTPTGEIGNRGATVTVMRSLLKINLSEPDDPKSELTAEFNSLSTYFDTGTVHISEPSLNLLFQKNGKLIEITTHISRDILSSEKIHLNALLRSIKENDPYTKNCILQHANDDSLDVQTTGAQSVYSSTYRKLASDAQSLNEDAEYYQIIKFLIRKGGIFALQFSPATEEKIADRNLKYNETPERIHYKDLTRRLKGNWYSISLDVNHIQSEIVNKRFAINKYEFAADDFKREVIWKCSRGDSNASSGELEGIVEDHSQQVIFVQTEFSGYDTRQNIHKEACEYHKMNSVAISFDGNDDTLYGLTTFIKKNLSYSIFEIFFRTDEIKFFAPQSISYDEFVKSDFLNTQKKSMLIDRINRNFGWPRTNEINLFDINYVGDYIVVIADYTEGKTFPQQKIKLLNISINIDPLGCVKEEVMYDGSNNTIIFYGTASITAINTLKLSTSTERGRDGAYFFQINRSQFTPSPYLKGVYMGEDKDGVPCSAKCLAIKVKHPDEKVSPGFLDSTSELYQKAEKALGESLIPITMEKFFLTI